MKQEMSKTKEWNELIDNIIFLLEKMKNDNKKTEEDETKNKSVSLLTIKECVGFIPGLSEHSIRLLALQGKIASIRAGEGKNGKILINKSSLIDYFSNQTISQN